MSHPLSRCRENDVRIAAVEPFLLMPDTRGERE
jgi:hypothetical protein